MFLQYNKSCNNLYNAACYKNFRNKCQLYTTSTIPIITEILYVLPLAIIYLVDIEKQYMCRFSSGSPGSRHCF